ncbi:tachykinin-4 isoform X4 [Arvicanthis niloticus]|uniref:tachykinin-4 isoform X4 n=1 Tax=Arvicanthis niloticus TaxID=61156 RepID=UPI00402B42B5
METEDGKSTEKEELGWERSISSDRLANHERTENAGRKHYTASSHGGCPWQAVISRSHILRHCAPVTGGNSAKVCTTAGDREELAFGADAESWVTVNLKGIPIPSIELQLQELKRSRTRQFYGLMGKRVEGIHPIQSTERMGYQLGRIVEDLLGTRSLSIQGTEEDGQSSESPKGRLPNDATPISPLNITADEPQSTHLCLRSSTRYFLPDPH